MERRNPFDLLKTKLEHELKNLNRPKLYSIGIYGSYVRGETVESWSDLDVLIFTNSNKIPLDLLLKLIEVKKKILTKDSNIQLTFRIHSKDEFPDYKTVESSICSYSLFSIYKDIITIFGKDLKEEMRKVLKTVTISKVESDLKSKIIGSRHESRSLISSSNSLQPFTQSFHVLVKIEGKKSYIVAKYIDMILECALCLNILKGDFSRKKEEIAREFSEFFHEFEFAMLPTTACKIRSEWNNKNLIIPTDFINHSAHFFEELFDLFEKNLKFNKINNAFEGLLVNDTCFPYRKNVCILLFKDNGNFLIVEKKNKEWQFVQGGVNIHESFEEALKRELLEETNIIQYNIIGRSKHINIFDWPEDLQKTKHFRGQEQHFFIVKVPDYIKVDLEKKELSSYKWVKLGDIQKFIRREDILESLEYIRDEFKKVFDD
ncbi:MAG TPA: NUDIX domain-containing protein [Candidatus Nanoarchaeia archaeon]|nr:NUDIX domain-containing protein [Candidatus Nanoarchaeia archaeon]